MRRLTINIDIDNGLKAKKALAQLSEFLEEDKGTKITIDFKNVKFIAANQLSVLGALFDDFCIVEGSSISIANLNIKLQTVMQKKWFWKYA